MRRPLLPALVVIAAVIAACAAPAAPGWTYAPAPSVTPAPSVAASGGGVVLAPVRDLARLTGSASGAEGAED